jgi:hypothetical protein
MEPDISILRKTGHFYFALTRTQVLTHSVGAAFEIQCRSTSEVFSVPGKRQCTIRRAFWLAVMVGMLLFARSIVQRIFSSAARRQ